jgi:hypothetical protein
MDSYLISTYRLPMELILSNKEYKFFLNRNL